MSALTDEIIIEESKKMFREVGYSKMRMVELAKRLDVSRGNLTYYYSNKDAVLENIWREYEAKIFDWINNENLPHFNRMTYRLYETMIFDINIFSDKELRKFYFDQMESAGYRSYMRKHIWGQIKTLVNSGIIKFNSNELPYLGESLTGAYKAIDLNYKENKFNIDIYEFIRIKQKIRLNIFSPENPESYADLEAAIEVLKSKDFSSIRCL